MKKILFLLVVLIPVLGWAGEYILYPNAAGTYQEWITGGSGSYHWDRVDDPHNYHDSDTSYLYVDIDVYDIETEHLQDATAIPDGDVIDSVRAHLTLRCEGSDEVLFVIYWLDGGNLKESVEKTAVATYPALTSYDYSDVRTTGIDDLAWTKTKLNTLQLGLYVNFSYEIVRVTAIHAHVYTHDPSMTKKISGTTNVEDSYIYEYDPNTNYGTANDIQTYKYTGQVRSGIIRVKNVASELEPGATNITAVCSLYCNTNDVNGSISAYRVFKPWTEDGVTWNDWVRTAYEWGTAGCLNASDAGTDNSGDGTDYDRKTTAEATVSVTTPATWYSWNISTALATGWYNGTIAERGIVLVEATTDGSNYFNSTEYTSNQPFFVFTYTYTPTSPTYLRPDGDLGTPQWETTYPASPTTHYTKIDESTVDDADYNKTKTLGKTDWFSLTDATGKITAGSTIDSVKITNRKKGEEDSELETQTQSTYYKIGTDSTNAALVSMNTSYANETSLKLNAPGGRSWSIANLDSLVLTLRKDMAGTPANTYYTYNSWLYVTIWWTPPVAGENKSHTITKDVEDCSGILEGSVVR